MKRAKKGGKGGKISTAPQKLDLVEIKFLHPQNYAIFMSATFVNKKIVLLIKGIVLKLAYNKQLLSEIGAKLPLRLG